jgi:hypothetical protein
MCSLAAYAERVRKWLIVAAALVLAEAVPVTVWAVNRSDGPSGFTDPRDAIVMSCGPIPLGPNFFWQSQPHGGYLDADGSATMTIRRTDKPLSHVVVKQTSDGKFMVEDCNAIMGLHG